MRLVWTKQGVRGRYEQTQPEMNFQRVSIRGFQRGFDAELETATEIVHIVKARGQERRREVTPRARPAN